jgi:hypothetical protein
VLEVTCGQRNVNAFQGVIDIIITMRTTTAKKMGIHKYQLTSLISYERCWPLACLEDLIKPNQASRNLVCELLILPSGYICTKIQVNNSSVYKICHANKRRRMPHDRIGSPGELKIQYNSIQKILGQPSDFILNILAKFVFI